MSKKAKSEIEAVVEQPTANLTHPAYTVFKDNGLWCVGQVKVDPVTKLTSNVVEVVESDLSKEVILERFKIRVAREVFINQ